MRRRKTSSSISLCEYDRFLAEKETCIIVGRCSDFVLSDMDNAIHIYIYASYEARLKHCVEDLHLSESEARKMMSSVDEAREVYHMNYAGYKPDDKRFGRNVVFGKSFDKFYGCGGNGGLSD